MLSTDQALADFAYLIDHLRVSLNAENSPIVGFGGSYGGMMAAWFRLKYPHMIDGVIAASAPIWTFQVQLLAISTTPLALNAPLCHDPDAIYPPRLYIISSFGRKLPCCHRVQVHSA